MGVQYLSIAAAGFLIFIIVLAILRLVLFSLLWIITTGKLHFWLFPNLTEDVGFFASFWPIYTVCAFINNKLLIGGCLKLGTYH